MRPRLDCADDERRPGHALTFDLVTAARDIARLISFVRTVRSECLDWLLIRNTPHLEHTLKVFVDHYNSGRPHRSLGLVPQMVGRPSSRKRSVKRSRDDGVTGLAGCCTSISARRERDRVYAPYTLPFEPRTTS